jgi:hypothetical protein
MLTLAYQVKCCTVNAENRVRFPASTHTTLTSLGWEEEINRNVHLPTVGETSLETATSTSLGSVRVGETFEPQRPPP